MRVLDSLERYLDKELGISLVTEPARVHFPRYLQGYYQWCQANMGERPVLLVEPQATALELQPGEKIGHLQGMEKEASLPVLWCADNMTAYERRLFNQQRIAYVIPGKQLNAPLLGLLASRAVQSPYVLREAFSPSAQAVLLWCLLKKKHDPVDSTMIGEATGYSRITVNRIMGEIEMLLPELVSVHKGRKFIRIHEAKEAWMRAKKYLESPVKRRYFVQRMENWPERLPVAGESALAAATALAEPGKFSWAVSAERYKILLKDECWREMAYAEQATDVIEVWSYDPVLLSSGRSVDPLSLMLSMRREAEMDPRVEAAIEHVEEELKW